MSIVARFSIVLIVFLFASFDISGQPFVNQHFADSLRKIGLDNKRLGRYKLAINLYQEALRGFAALGLPEEIADCHNKIGVVYFNLSEYDKALQHYMKSFHINDSLHHQSGLLKNYINLSNYYAKTHQYERARELNRKGQSLAKSLNNKSGLALLYSCFGNIFIQADNPEANPDSAYVYYSKMLPIYLEDNYAPGVAAFYQNLGLMWESFEEPDSAKTYYQKSIALWQTVGSSVDQIGLYRNLGNIEHKYGNFNRAIMYYDSGLNLAIRHDLKSSIQAFAGNKAEVFRHLGHYQDAYEMLLLQKGYSDSVFNENMANTTEELSILYETEQKEKALALIRGEVLRKTAERDGYLIALAVFLALAIVLVLIYQQRQKAMKALREKDKSIFDQKINHLLLEQEVATLNAMLDGQERERKRISRELHDRVGSLLTALKYSYTSKNGQNGETVKLIDNALEETRNLSHTFASGVLSKFGLVAAIEDLKTTIERDHQMAINLDYWQVTDRLDNAMEIDLYRIVQELVSNTLKHAKANTIDIQLMQNNGQLELMYEDNGMGFTSSVMPEGIGLKNIHARTEKYQGKLELDSRAGHGMRVHITIPISEDEKITSG